MHVYVKKPIGMLAILLVADPLQILNTVVGFVAIAMVNLVIWRWPGSQKCVGNQTMHKHVLGLSIST